MRRRSDNLAAWALLGSALLHGGFLLWLGLRHEEPWVVPGKPVELIIVEVVRPPPAPPAPPSPAAPPRPRPPPMARVNERVEPPPPKPPAEPPPQSDRPVADAPAAPALQRLPFAPPSLVPGSAFALSLDAGVQDDVPRLGELSTPTPQQLVERTARETIGRGRVDRGLVNPYYSQLGKALVKNWDADRAVKQGGLKGYGEQLVQNTRIWNEVWLGRAEQYAKTGSPLGDEDLAPQRRAPVNDRIQGLPGVDLEQRKELQRAMGSQFSATRKATIRVVQDKTGKLLRVELVTPSSDATVDREAMQDVRDAAEKLPPPPDDALEGRQRLSSLWSFELIVSISPPVPTFTFEFDEALKTFDARLPLDRRIYKKVRLVSVE